jgi:hypothetical protein
MSNSEPRSTPHGPQIGRLALRVEGDNWNAYYVLHTDSMKDAIYLGSISMTAVSFNEKRKDEFMALMREVVGDMIEDITGVRPEWGGPKPAPEHERSRNA